MKSSNYYKNSFLIKSKIKDFFIYYKIPIISYIIVLIFGFLIGIFVCSNNGGNLNLNNFFDETYIKYLSNKTNNWTIFLIQGITIIIVSLFTIFFSNNIIFICINFCIIFIRGYILGFDTVCIVLLFPLLGLILSIILYTITLLTINILYSIICAIAYKKYKILKKYGCSYYKNCKNPNKSMFLILFIILIILFIQCLTIFIVKGTTIF